MKKTLLIGLFACLGLGLNLHAQNVLSNGEFKTEVATVVKNANKAVNGEWFILNNETEGATVITWNGATGDQTYPSAMVLDNSGAAKNLSWYKAFIGQRLTGGLEKAIYTLTFYVKSEESGASVGAYIKQSVEEKSADTGKYGTTFFVRNNYDEASQRTASAAQYTLPIKGKGKWVKVTVDFDMSRVVNTVNSQSANADLTISNVAADSAILKDCYLALSVQNKGAVVQISGVSLTKK